MTTIRDVIDWLHENEIFHIDVFDPKTDKELFTRVSAAEIENKFGGEDQFLEKIFEKADSVTVLKTRKYGASYHRIGAPQMFRFSSNSENSNVGESESASQPAAQFPATNFAQGLAGLNAPGLGAYIEATNKAALLGEITRQKEKAELENEHLKKENDRLKDEVNELKRDSDTQPDALTNIITKAVESGQAAQIVEVFMSRQSKVGAAPESLNAPELSRTKREFIAFIQQNEVEDKLLQEAFKVISFAMSGNQEFINDYQALILKYNA